MKFKVDKKIFETFPGVKLGVVVVLGAKVVEEAPEITKLLSEWQEKQKNEFIGVDLPNFDKIRTWREAYSKFGSKPSKYNSSIESLLKRVVSGGKLPNINSLVDLYNAISLKHVLPFGAEDLDRVKGNIRLAFAEGKEAGKYIGSDLIDTCEKGEVVYLDDFGFICRRWNWREADRTKITQETKNFILVAEAMPPVSSEQLERAIDDFLGFSSKYLGGKYQKFVIDAENPGIEVDFQTGSKLVDQDLRNLQIGIVQKIEAQKVYVGYAKEIFDSVKSATGLEDIDIDFPENEGFGDYSSNIAMAMFSNFHDEASYSFPISKFKSPRELAQHLANKLQTDKKLSTAVEKIEVAGPGFINFWLKKDILVDNLIQIDIQKEDYGKSDLLKNKKYLIEHTSPNPNKALHLGHLRNNVTAMAISNIWEFVGCKVIRDCIDNNRGIAIAKLMWGYLKFAHKQGKQDLGLNYWFDHQDQWQTPEDRNLSPDKFVDELYVKASQDFENPEVEKKVRQMVVDWEGEDPKTWSLWKKVLEYSYEGQKGTLKRLGNRWDKVWHEHEHYKIGKKIVEEGLKKGVFKIGKEGAIVTNFARYKIPDTVVIKSDGTALYITQDLALTKLKKESFAPDKLFWVIGPEQSLALKQMFAACEQLGIGKLEDFVHIAYGYMSIEGQGKMSSRTGNVIYIDDLLDLSKAKVKEIMKELTFGEKEMDKIAEEVGIGAVKYSILKVGRLQDIAFDINESVSIEGNSGPYLQYTVARTNSVLAKSTNYSSMAGKQIYKSTDKLKINDEELKVLRALSRFSEVIADSAKSYSPNTLCNYLFDLAQKFNNFYNVHRIIGSENEDSRLALTTAVGIVLKNGLKLLGIQAPARM